MDADSGFPGVFHQGVHVSSLEDVAKAIAAATR
jgi:hypothetical protein